MLQHHNWHPAIIFLSNLVTGTSLRFNEIVSWQQIGLFISQVYRIKLRTFIKWYNQFLVPWDGLMRSIYLLQNALRFQSRSPEGFSVCHPGKGTVETRDQLWLYLSSSVVHNEGYCSSVREVLGAMCGWCWKCKPKAKVKSERIVRKPEQEVSLDLVHGSVSW